MLNSFVPCHVMWSIIERDEWGNVIEEREMSNLVVNDGRDMLLKDLFMLTGSSGVVCLGVGASTTTASVTDTRLTHELIGNPTRKSLVNTSNAALSPSDIVSETATISGVVYYKKLVCQATWDVSDGNNGNQFGEYGLFTTNVLPGTPTGTSGTMFNHLIDFTPPTKSASNSITAVVTVRF